jgi:hypothetical protein
LTTFDVPLEQPRPRLPAIALGLVGFAALGAGLAFDLRLTAIGGMIFFAAMVVAAWEARAPVLTWPNALAAFTLLIWLVPAKDYRVAVDLPFNLEFYRVFAVILVGVFLVALLAGQRRVSAGGMGLAVSGIALTVLLTQTANIGALDDPGQETTALKGFFYMATFLLVFVLVCSTVADLRGAERIVKALVVGAFLVAVGAIVQSRTSYNVFAHLDDVIPGLRREDAGVGESRSGVFRVTSSAQQPIALGAALMLSVPLGIYLVTRSGTARRKAAWTACTVIIAFGAFVPVARTAIVMGVVMTILALVLWGHHVVRFWPVPIVALAALHLVSPGVMGAVYKSFFPKQGLVQDVTGREGLAGSGRLSDIGPGFDLWETSPLFGIGRGNPKVGGQEDPDRLNAGEIIFDNQYMSTLVLTGALGLAAVLLFVVGAAIRLLNAGYIRAGPEGTLVAVCGLAVTGFAVAMFFFDAFAFVQVTVVFMVIAALGLRMRQLALAEGAPATVAVATVRAR